MIYALRMLEITSFSIMLSGLLLVVFSAAMMISNIQLIRKEGFSFVNMLGIILPLMISAYLFYTIAYYSVV